MQPEQVQSDELSKQLYAHSRAGWEPLNGYGPTLPREKSPQTGTDVHMGKMFCNNKNFIPTFIDILLFPKMIQYSILYKNHFIAEFLSFQ